MNKDGVCCVVKALVASGVISSDRIVRLPVIGSTIKIASPPDCPFDPPISVTISLPSARIAMPLRLEKLGPVPTVGLEDELETVVLLPVAGSTLMIAITGKVLTA